MATRNGLNGKNTLTDSQEERITLCDVSSVVS